MDAESPPTIAGYRELTQVGRGAVGSVFRAVREADGGTVAVKVLKLQGEAGRKAVTRLVREYRFLARLRHPGIVRGIDFGETEGAFWIAMEFAEGKTVRELLEGGKDFSEGEALRIAAEVAAAMRHYAAAGIVHRDLKPANLMLGPSGSVKIMDLGLAKDELDLALTHTGTTVGTPQYLSPEQARDPRQVDIRSDVYSLGACLYHMAVGEPPFRGDTLAEVITKILFEREAPADAARPGLSAAFGALLRRMMEKRPEARFPGPDALLRAIRRVQRGKLPDAPLLSPGARIALGAAAAAILGVGMWALLPRGQGARAPRGGTEVAAAPEPAPEERPPPAPEEPGGTEFHERLRRAETEARELIAAGRPVPAVRRFLWEWGDEERPEEVEEVLGRLRAAVASLLRPELERTLARAGRDEEGFAERIKAVEEAEARLSEAADVLAPDVEQNLRARLEEGRSSVTAAARRLLEDRRRRFDALLREGRFSSAGRILAELGRRGIEHALPAFPVEAENLARELEEERARAGERLWNDYAEFRRGFELDLARRDDLKGERSLQENERRFRTLERELEIDRVPEILAALEEDRLLLDAWRSLWPLVVESLRGDVGREVPLAIGPDRNRKRIISVDAAGLNYVFPQKPDDLKAARLADLAAEEVAARAAAGGAGPGALATFHFLEAVRGRRTEEAWNALKALPAEDALRAELEARLQRVEQEILARSSQGRTNAERMLEEAEGLLREGRPLEAKAAAEMLQRKPEFRPFLAEHRRAVEEMVRRAEEEIRFEGWRARLKGAVARLPGPERRVEIAYDFSDPAQAADWEPLQGWVLKEGKLAVAGETAGGAPLHRSGCGLAAAIPLNVYRGASVEAEVTTAPEGQPRLFAISLLGNHAGFMNLKDVARVSESFHDRFFRQTNVWKGDLWNHEVAFHLDGRGLPVPPGIRHFALDPGRRYLIRLALERHGGEYLLVLSVDGAKVISSAWIPEPGRSVEFRAHSLMTLDDIRVSGVPRSP